VHPGPRRLKVCGPSLQFVPAPVAHNRSPELVAKLGHDYTVYAYDFSEYETPLVGQGMLSWILASASNTPNAPAEDSQTMVTGLVCKNMTVFGNGGVQETLEVKLKLVPVPNSLQREYVENMERYHSLSQLMPAGFDYNAWSDFLKENPTLNQLAQPAPGSQRSSTGGVEAFHQMLTRNSPSQEPIRADSYHSHPYPSISSQPTRASSPAMSTLSYHHYVSSSRPTSRNSVRSETAGTPQQYQPYPQYPAQQPYVMEQQEEGPPKKRARIMQTKRPKNTPLTAHNDSLRVAASTAASVRLYRPVAPVSAALASAESIPRVPTPRPGDGGFGNRQNMRPLAPSALRRASMDEGRSYVSPYESPAFSDNTVDSADERGGSPGDTPMDMPSSPPVGPQRTASPDPSSPTLPTLPLPIDSGFVSDVVLGQDAESMDIGRNISDMPTAPRGQSRAPRRPNNGSANPWKQVEPGPVDRLPQSYVPRPRMFHRKSEVRPTVESVEQDTRYTNTPADDIFSLLQQEPNDGLSYIQAGAFDDRDLGDHAARLENTDPHLYGHEQPQLAKANSITDLTSPEASCSHVSPFSEADARLYSRSATPQASTVGSRPPKGLARAQTWSGTGEPMSDAFTPSDATKPPAQRKDLIKENLDKCIAAGELPPHCKNCGEIDTPVWRKIFTRIEYGSADAVTISTDPNSTGIFHFEVIPPTAEDARLSYRIFKRKITPDDQKAESYEELRFCNPCGMWFAKKAELRPQHLWQKSRASYARMKRNRQSAAAIVRSQSQGIEPSSDAPAPNCEPAIPGVHEAASTSNPAPLIGSVAAPAPRTRSYSFQPGTSAPQVHKEAAEEALRRAIQSSPAGFHGSKQSPIEVDEDLTPKPTRRLLFPPPNSHGEQPSVDGNAATTPNLNGNSGDDAQLPPPCVRCKSRRRRCDRKQPCGRCEDAGLDPHDCVPSRRLIARWKKTEVDASEVHTPEVHMAIVEDHNPDKENRPPPPAEEDDLRHLFEDPVSPKTTPTNKDFCTDMLKTPTPSSRSRNALTPRRGEESWQAPPSRNILTPRSTRPTTVAPETPFTRQLNAMLSDCHNSSPSQSQAIDFSAFPTFNTPGRTGAQFIDFLPDDFLSSDMAYSSSPTKDGALDLGFDLYEDPNTSTMGLWSGASMFGSDAMLDLETGTAQPGVGEAFFSQAPALLKMNVGGITVDFAAMIDDVVAPNADEDMDVKASANAEDDQSQAFAKTPDVPVVD
jgi:hypothetical protein